MKSWIKRAPWVCFGIMTIIAFLLILFTMVVFGWHTMLLNNEESLLRNTGYWSQKDVGEYKLNTYVTAIELLDTKSLVYQVWVLMITLLVCILLIMN